MKKLIKKIKNQEIVKYEKEFEGVKKRKAQKELR